MQHLAVGLSQTACTMCGYTPSRIGSESGSRRMLQGYQSIWIRAAQRHVLVVSFGTVSESSEPIAVGATAREWQSLQMAVIVFCVFTP